MATQLKTKLKTRHVPMVSVSATLVKTLAGAQAYKAKRKISVEDDKHITDITRGETFYLKHDAKKRAYILFDVDTDDNTIYKFIIDKTTYNKLVGSHTELGAVEKKPSDSPEHMITTKAGTAALLKRVRNLVKQEGLNARVEIQSDEKFAMGGPTFAFITIAPKNNLDFSGNVALVGVNADPVKGNYYVSLEDAKSDELLRDYTLVKGGFDAAVKEAVAYAIPYSVNTKPQDYRNQIPFEFDARLKMLQTVFPIGTLNLGTKQEITMDVTSSPLKVKREFKKAGFKPLTTKGSVVKFIHSDGTQMDVAVKSDYLAIRFN